MYVHTQYIQCSLTVLLNCVVDNVAVVRTYVHTYLLLFGQNFSLAFGNDVLSEIGNLLV